MPLRNWLSTVSGNISWSTKYLMALLQFHQMSSKYCKLFNKPQLKQNSKIKMGNRTIKKILTQNTDEAHITYSQNETQYELKKKPLSFTDFSFERGH